MSNPLMTIPMFYSGERKHCKLTTGWYGYSKRMAEITYVDTNGTSQWEMTKSSGAVWSI